MTRGAHFPLSIGVPTASEIRGWMQRGHDTVDIARILGMSEATIWNALATDDRRQAAA